AFGGTHFDVFSIRGYGAASGQSIRRRSKNIPLFDGAFGDAPDARISYSFTQRATVSPSQHVIRDNFQRQPNPVAIGSGAPDSCTRHYLHGCQ
ncbi:hypothetical protein E4U53_000315, partial [Claviceps sorghi]